MRAQQKATKGDKLFLLKWVRCWQSRFLAGSSKSKYSDFAAIKALWDSSCPQMKDDESALATQLYVTDFGTPDWLINAIDFHIFSSILDEALEDSTELYIALLQHVLQKGKASTSSVDVVDVLQEMIWHKRSNINKKKPILNIWPSGFKENEGGLKSNQLESLFAKHGEEIVNRSAARYLLRSYPQVGASSGDDVAMPNRPIETPKNRSLLDKTMMKGVEAVKGWNDAKEAWQPHIRRICEIFLTRTEIINYQFVRRDSASGKKVNSKAQFFIYKILPSGDQEGSFVITRVGGERTPHCRIPLSWIEKGEKKMEEEEEENNGEDKNEKAEKAVDMREIVKDVLDVDNIQEDWRTVLTNLLREFEEKKTKGATTARNKKGGGVSFEPIVYRPSWYTEEGGFPMSLCEIQVERAEGDEDDGIPRWVTLTRKAAKGVTQRVSIGEPDEVSEESAREFFAPPRKDRAISLPARALRLKLGGSVTKEEGTKEKKEREKEKEKEAEENGETKKKGATVSVLGYKAKGEQMKFEGIYDTAGLRAIAMEIRSARNPANDGDTMSVESLYALAKHLMVELYMRLVKGNRGGFQGIKALVVDTDALMSNQKQENKNEKEQEREKEKEKVGKIIDAEFQMGLMILQEWGILDANGRIAAGAASGDIAMLVGFLVKGIPRGFIACPAKEIDAGISALVKERYV